MPPTSIVAKSKARYSAPINPAFDSVAFFECNTSPEIFATVVSALEIVRPPLASSFTLALAIRSIRALFGIRHQSSPRWTNACLHRSFFVDQRGARTGIDDKSSRTAVERALHIEVVVRVQPYRHSGKASPGKKSRQFFADRSARSGLTESICHVQSMIIPNLRISRRLPHINGLLGSLTVGICDPTKV